MRNTTSDPAPRRESPVSTLLVRNAEMLVTMDDERREIPGGGIYAEDSRIVAVGPTDELPTDADTVLDMAGQIVLPGMINTHHHLDQTLTRNLPQAQKARSTVIEGRVVVENGSVTTVEMEPVIEAHNQFSLEHSS